MTDETVILVHGLWMRGLEMGWLRQRLEQAGYLTRRFSYHSTSNSPLENALDLNDFVAGIESPVINFVCHSLGGIVARHLFYHFPQQKPGRIVTLGTPHQGSQSAKGLGRIFPGRLLLGKSIRHGLFGPVPPWPAANAIGSIAGTTRMGLGLLIPGLQQPSDGTVAVAETRLEGMADHIEVPVTHTSMLFSKAVAYQTCYFLRNGRFDHC